MIATIRTFAASLIIPGWGYLIVGNRKLGLVTACIVFASVMLFGWTRLILEPVGLRVLIACLLVTIFGAALHSALIEFRHDDVSRNWKQAFFFAAAYIVLALLLFSNRSVTLGYETYRLPANSMAPTLLAGDYIVVDTWRYRSADPEFGDIVVFELPESGVNYIKRIAGLPGESVSIQSNQLMRDGRAVDELYAIYNGPDRPIHILAEQTVSQAHYLLLGDNRNNSRDSRHFGTIPRDKIVGRITHVFYSSDDDAGTRWDRIPTQFE